MQFAQIRDRVPVDDGPLDLSAFSGTWVNSNPETSGIARLLMTEEGGRLMSMMDSAWDGVGTDADRWWM